MTRMNRSRFNEEQIFGILREQEAGPKTVDVCRKHGVSSATFDKWKAAYGGMDVSLARSDEVHPAVMIGCSSRTTSSKRSTSAISRDVPVGVTDQLQCTCVAGS